ncbi:hypothetical protein CCACVL1_12186 [Corchorus capsularis]|uniref:Uncharacterized protein n=1 Tax=Corchorus capsularis TaxID=210143 RepID=A0A1R3IGU5_COCAP|nr:hypothetical protein CCACVL1_12186 [Corchorus capsularis]
MTGQEDREVHPYSDFLEHIPKSVIEPLIA